MANQLRPKLLIQAGRENQPLRVPLADLIAVPLAQTFLTSDTNTTTSLGVKNTNGFSVSSIGMIGAVGNEGTELGKINAVTSPSTIGLSSGTNYPHSANTPVVLLPYDQIEISNAATLAGSKSVLSTFNITPDQTETLYNDTAGSTGYYFARFKNSITATFSPYSDGVPVGGYAENSARRIIDKALKAIHKEDATNILTDDFAFGELNNCQQEVKNELKRWSWLQNFNANLGASTTGGWLVAVPTDLDDQNTNKSVYNFRVGGQSDMMWVDKESFDRILGDVAWTTLKNNISVNDTTITLTDSHDFGTSGTVVLGAHTYAFSANNVSTGVLTLDTSVFPSGSTTSDTAGAYAFINASLGTPTYWTTWGGNIYHYPLMDSTLAPANYYMDYYKSLTTVTSDTDTVIIPDPLVPQYYLQWKFLLRINNGEETQASTAQMNNYILRREKLKQKETLGTSFVLKPRFNDFSRQMRGMDDDSTKAERDGNFPNI